MVLQLWRRHTTNCPHQTKGREYGKCAHHNSFFTQRASQPYSCELKLAEAFVAALPFVLPGHQLVQGDVESLLPYPAIGHHVVSWHIAPQN